MSQIFAVLALLASSVRGDEVIRSPSELTAACQENRYSIPFEVNGIIVIPPTIPQCPFTILSGNMFLTLVDMRTNSIQRTTDVCQVGDQVKVFGRTEPYLAKNKTTANCHQLQILKSNMLPDATYMSMRDFLSGRPSPNTLIALHGTLQDVFPDDLDVHYICAILKDGDQSVNLTCHCPRSWLSDFRSLLGCEVIATGIDFELQSNNPRDLGPRLRVAGTNAFRIVSRATGYPFGVPEFSSTNATNPHALAKLGPQILRGTVLAVWGRESFLLRSTDGRPVHVDLAEGSLPNVHATIEVVGMVETDLCDITLSRALWRTIRLPPTNGEATEETPLQRLFTNGRCLYASININAHGKTLTVRGTVKSVSGSDDGSRRLLIADGENTLPVICGPDAIGNPPPEEGWSIAVTGVCVKDSDVWRPTVPIPKIRGLFLVTRTNADIVILQKSPWWTPTRLWIAIAVLLVLLVAIFSWNASLRILIDRRSREVIKAQTAKIESELRIAERTRLAADLHDNTVQNLTAIAYRITAAQGALDCRECEAGHILQIASKMLKSCRTSLRQCLWDLRNDALSEPDFGIAIRRTVETVAGDAKLSIRFAGERNLINDSTAHAILNILRELVANATIHGKANTVIIAGEARPEIIRFSVCDNGIGFNPAHRPGQDDGHFGLDGIMERLVSLGGTLKIDSSAGNGAYIRIVINPERLSQDNNRI